MKFFFMNNILDSFSKIDKFFFDFFSNKSVNYDTSNILAKSFSKNFLYNFFQIITKLGEGYFEAIIILFLLTIVYFNKNKLENYKNYIFNIISLFFVSGIAVSILKRVFGRARPYVYFNPNIFNVFNFDILFNSKFHSFPSGHTMTIWTTIWFLSFHIKNKLFKFCLFLLGSIVGLSRIYLSYHWFTDIIVSIIISYFIVKAFMKFSKKNYFLNSFLAKK